MNRKTQSWFVIAAVMALLPATQASGVPKTIHVDDDSGCTDPCDRAGGTGTCGDSFGTACQTLQAALSTAIAGDQIWVEQGKYYPDLPADDNDRDATFDVGGGTGPQLYGGFFGNETAVSQRSFKCYDGVSYGTACIPPGTCGPEMVCHSEYETILSGDLAQDDESNCTSCAGYCVGGVCLEGVNSYHVVSCHHVGGGTPRLDGFVIEGGVADGPGPNPGETGALDNQGAAIQIRGVEKRCCTGCFDPLVADVWETSTCTEDADCTSPAKCQFFPCFALGMDVYNCMVRYNYSKGHGAVNDHFAASTFDNCYFHHNEAENEGAALLIDNGSASVTNSLFKNNNVTASGSEGGAVWIQGRDGTIDCPNDPAATVSTCRFEGNTASATLAKGGGMWIEDSNPSVTDCVFFRNHAKIGGGGVWVQHDDGLNPTSPTFTECDFVENQQNSLGGAGVYVAGDINDIGKCQPSFSNCNFFKNGLTEAGAFCGGSEKCGGAAYCVYSIPSFDGCEFRENHGLSQYGGGATFSHSCGTQAVPMTVTNCAFLSNTFSNWTPGTIGGGSALLLSDGYFEVDQCIIMGNATDLVANNDGTIRVAVLASMTTDAIISNSIFFDNKAQDGGAVVGDGNSTVTVTNCTITENDASDKTGGLRGVNTVRNCVVWGNTDVASSVPEREQISPGTTPVTHSDIENCSEGAGTFCDDPNDNNIGADTSADNPDFVSDETGAWDAAPAYDAASDTTTFTDSTPSPGWTAYEWIGEIIMLVDTVPNPDVFVYAKIIDNTTTEIIVNGDLSDATASGENYTIPNLRLDSTTPSPCIDAGNNSDIVGILDLDEKCRIIEEDTRDVDMGAYEHGTDPSCCLALPACCSGVCASGRVCCNSVCYTGDCCNSSDCGRGKICIGHRCIPQI